MHRLGLGERVHRAVEVTEQAVVEAVDPAVDRQRLAAIPRIANDRRLADISHLLDHIKLAQPIDGGRTIGDGREAPMRSAGRAVAAGAEDQRREGVSPMAGRLRIVVRGGFAGPRRPAL